MVWRALKWFGIFSSRPAHTLDTFYTDFLSSKNSCLSHTWKAFGKFLKTFSPFQEHLSTSGCLGLRLPEQGGFVGDCVEKKGAFDGQLPNLTNSVQNSIKLKGFSLYKTLLQDLVLEQQQQFDGDGDLEDENKNSGWSNKPYLSVLLVLVLVLILERLLMLLI